MKVTKSYWDDHAFFSHLWKNKMWKWRDDSDYDDAPQKQFGTDILFPNKQLINDLDNERLALSNLFNIVTTIFDVSHI